MKKVFVLFISAVIFLPMVCQAQMANQSDVVISEIAWMGTAVSGNEEWIELKNTTDKEININGWTLKTVDEKIKISLTGAITGQGFYILERTDDNSLPHIFADIIYKGSLSNTGQYLKLYDASNNLIDQVDFTATWPAGNNTTKQTMERTATLAWQTSASAGGTPGTQNSLGATEKIEPQKETASKITPAPEPVAAPVAITYPEGIVINELLPSPDGADETNEFIELYNSTEASIDISGWKLQDIQGTQTTYVFPANSNVAAHEYLALTRPTTNILLNNDQDGANLLWPDGKITDTISYSSAPTKKSYSKTSNGWQWSTSPTPGLKNIITAEAAKPKALPKPKKTDNKVSVATTENKPLNLDKHIFAADLSQTTSNPWWLFMIAGAITLFSGAIFLLFKLTIFKKS